MTWTMFWPTKHLCFGKRFLNEKVSCLTRLHWTMIDYLLPWNRPYSHRVPPNDMKTCKAIGESTGMVTSFSCTVYASVKETIIGSDNDMSSVHHWAIIWINAVILSTGPMGTNCRILWIKIKISNFGQVKAFEAALCTFFCLGLHVSNLGCFTILCSGDI